MLTKKIIGNSEVPDGGDGRLRLQLKDKFLLSSREFPCQEFGPLILMFPCISGKSGGW